MLTTQELESVFNKHYNLKGIPGTKMENFAKDFIDFVYKLNSHPDVFITHLYIGELPLSYEKDKRYNRYVTKPLGFEVNLELLSFYLQFNP